MKLHLKQAIQVAGVAISTLFCFGGLVAGCDSSDDDSTGDGSGLEGGAAVTGNGGSGGGGMFGDGGLLGPDGSNGNTDGTAACGTDVLDKGNEPAKILLLIDKSGSMNSEGGFDDTKWNVMRDALGDALRGAPEQLSFALDFFPKDDNSDGGGSAACGLLDSPNSPPELAMGSGATHVTDLLSTINAAAPGGGTPAADALERALAYFNSTLVPGERGFVLLATDGGPNCNFEHAACAEASCTLNMDGNNCSGNCCTGAVDVCLDDVASTQAVTDLLAAGVQTFVVGIPGSEAYIETLNAMATAGGRALPAGGPTDPVYFAVGATPVADIDAGAADAGADSGEAGSDAATPNAAPPTSSGDLTGLTEVLQAITSDIITDCRLQLTAQPEDNNLVKVLTDGTELVYSNTTWTLDTTTNPPTVLLHGDTCADIEVRGMDDVTIIFSCDARIR
ncbi:MAG: VWA domain-containing protein [Polyangiaceae bacterium]|nr:VWA domain-containing protein [Polyangiaceae bacterium]